MDLHVVLSCAKLNRKVHIYKFQWILTSMYIYIYPMKFTFIRRWICLALMCFIVAQLYCIYMKCTFQTHPSLASQSSYCHCIALSFLGCQSHSSSTAEFSWVCSFNFLQHIFVMQFCPQHEIVTLFLFRPGFNCVSE